MHHRISRWPVLLSAMLVTAGTVLAGTTGKLTGKVVNRETGEAVADATIREVKTRLFGGPADDNGKFFILNIPPGIYDVEVTHMNYHQLVIKNVQINIDYTTTLTLN
jgi:hypothetical protein